MNKDVIDYQLKFQETVMEFIKKYSDDELTEQYLMLNTQIGICQENDIFNISATNKNFLILINAIKNEIRYRKLEKLKYEK